MKNIPNVLSVLRLAMIGVFIWFFRGGQYVAVLITYVTAVLTDILDGYLARRNNWITNVGKVLDPLADKLMLLTALVCFSIRGWVPLLLVLIVAVKELLMIIGGIFLWKRKVVVYADRFGKCATGFFNTGVVATLLKEFWPWIGSLNLILLGIAVLLALVALFHYGRKDVIGHMDEIKPS